MLTKEEREEIAGRLKKCTCMIADSAYKALFNKEVPSWTTWQQDSNDATGEVALMPMTQKVLSGSLAPMLSMEDRYISTRFCVTTGN